MRINEVVNPDIYHSEFKHELEIGDYRYTAETDNDSGYGNQFIIKVYDGEEEIANAEFIEEPEDKALISANTWVKEEYQGQNIATNMYAYAKMLGNDIMPSWNQTDAGERMWRSWNQSGQSKHILPKDNKGYRELEEHSRWERDPFYTEDRERKIYLAIAAVQSVASNNGIMLDFRDHFFDQLFVKRGMSRIDESMLLNTFGRILHRGLHLFRNKEPGTDLVFYDPTNDLNIPFVKVKENVYRIPTIVRDLRWLGPQRKVTLN